jgi:hypothetical protein
VCWLFIVSGLTFWLWMMCCHEFGHVLHAWLTGGTVTKVVLHPLAISRTDISPNPSPRLVVWGGPLWGVVVPLLISVMFRWRRWRGSKWLDAFAGFCLIANGLYLASGILDPAGDTEELLRLGTPAWALLAAGGPMAIGGVLLWHRLGKAFGTRNVETAALQWAAVVTTLILVGSAMIMWLVGGV